MIIKIEGKEFQATSDGLAPITDSYYIEIIGNIHENPELLEGK